MIGRGIDQILPHPCDPVLHEDYTQSAIDYVQLADALNNPIPRSVGPAYIWGEARDEFARMRPDARIINLEALIDSAGLSSMVIRVIIQRPSKPTAIVSFSMAAAIS